MKVNDKVKCINGRYRSFTTDPFKSEDLNEPVQDEIYTVREVIETPYGIGIKLVEIVNDEFYHDDAGWQEPIFAIRRFEKVEQ